jgi:hypothetical protein
VSLDALQSEILELEEYEQKLSERVDAMAEILPDFNTRVKAGVAFSEELGNFSESFRINTEALKSVRGRLDVLRRDLSEREKSIAEEERQVAEVVALRCLVAAIEAKKEAYRLQKKFEAARKAVPGGFNDPLLSDDGMLQWAAAELGRRGISSL